MADHHPDCYAASGPVVEGKWALNGCHPVAKCQQSSMVAQEGAALRSSAPGAPGAMNPKYIINPKAEYGVQEGAALPSSAHGAPGVHEP